MLKRYYNIVTIRNANEMSLQELIVEYGKGEVGLENITRNEEKLSNANSPFTEIFSLLKRYKKQSVGVPLLAYKSDELRIIARHVNNAVSILLQGLQGVGELISSVAENKKSSNGLNFLGFFISAISNLTEALNDLRSDTEYVIKQRRINKK